MNPSIGAAIWHGLASVAVLCAVLFAGVLMVIKLGKTSSAIMHSDKH